MEIIAEVEDIVTDLANLTLPDQMQAQLTSEFVAVVDVLSLLNKYVGISMCMYIFVAIMFTNPEIDFNNNLEATVTGIIILLLQATIPVDWSPLVFKITPKMYTCMYSILWLCNCGHAIGNHRLLVVIVDHSYNILFLYSCI